MIKTRLIRLLKGSGKYIGYQVFWQWCALLAQIAVVTALCGLFGHMADGGADAEQIASAAAVLALGLLVRFVSDRMAARASYLASADVKRVLREKIYEKLLRLGTSYQEQIATSEVVQLSTEGVEQLETYFGKYLPQLFYSLLAPVTLFLVLKRVSFRASLILLLCVPLIPLSIVAVQKFAKKLLSKYWSIYAGLGDSFLENLQGLTTLKIYQADEKKAQEMDEESQHFRRISMKVLTMQLNSTSVMDIVAYGGAAVGMITACREFLRGSLGLTGALTIVLLAAEFFLPLRLLGSFFHIAMNGMAASDKIFRLLDLEEPDQGTKVLEGDLLNIELKDVHFSYEKDREILKGIDLALPSGTFVSIVGVSGCGKSTIAGILTGRNRHYSGAVTIAGMELRDISEASLQQKITLVRHNSYLFTGTVAENLRMAKPTASDAELKAVLEKVNLLGFLEEQEGLSTKLAEGGSNLSGGQRQRLAIARALLHDTPVYLFDEAASNIDAESEELIMEVVRELAKDRTVLLISHRLFNVIPSDCIYMMKDGVIAEKGTHQELMARGGEYAMLYESQRALEEYGKEGVQA